MLIFITGASGLVGSYIARKLIQEGHQVRALKRASTSLKLIADVAAKIEWVEGDLLDTQPLLAHLQGVEVVVHAAAMVSFSSSEQEEMWKVNVEGTANLVNACLLTPSFKKFVHISSIAALGRTKKNTSINEELKWESSDENTYYALTKYQAELEVWRGSEEGLSVIVVNPSIVLGGGDWTNGSTALFKYIHDQKPFYPRGNLNYVDVRDIANAISQLLIQNIHNQRFILNGGNIPYKQFMEIVAAQWKINAPRYEVTPMMAEIAWRWEWLKSVFTGKKALITRETARMSSKNYQYETQKIQQTIGFQFTDLNDTIRYVCQKLI